VTFDVLEDGQIIETSGAQSLTVRVVPNAQYLRDMLNEAGLVVEEEWGIGQDCYVPFAEAKKPETYVLAVARAKK
jgi:hypothetical protein